MKKLTITERMRLPVPTAASASAPSARPTCEVLLVGTVKEQDVQMMQVVMEKVVGERIVYAVDVFALAEEAQAGAECFDIHNHLF